MGRWSVADDVGRADDYLARATAALDEARSALDAAGGVFVEGQEARQQLGDALGRALNAVGRARADVEAHRARVGREQATHARVSFSKACLLQPTSGRSSPWPFCRSRSSLLALIRKHSATGNFKARSRGALRTSIIDTDSGSRPTCSSRREVCRPLTALITLSFACKPKGATNRGHSSVGTSLLERLSLTASCTVISSRNGFMSSFSPKP